MAAKEARTGLRATEPTAPVPTWRNTPSAKAPSMQPSARSRRGGRIPQMVMRSARTPVSMRKEMRSVTNQAPVPVRDSGMPRARPTLPDSVVVTTEATAVTSTPATMTRKPAAFASCPNTGLITGLTSPNMARSAILRVPMRLMTE